MRNWCCRMHLDSWKLPLEDAGLAHGGLTVSCGGVGGGGLAPSSPYCNSFRYFVFGESEVWVIEKSLNKTNDLIQKMKEVLGSFNRDTVVKAYKSLRPRIWAGVNADGSFNT